MPFTRRFTKRRVSRRPRRFIRRARPIRPLRTRRFRPRRVNRRRRVNVGDYYKRVFRVDGLTVTCDETPTVYANSFAPDSAQQGYQTYCENKFGPSEGRLLTALMSSFRYYRLKRITVKAVPSQMPAFWLGCQSADGDPSPMKAVSYPFSDGSPNVTYGLNANGAVVPHAATQLQCGLLPYTYQQSVNQSGARVHTLNKDFTRSFIPHFFEPTALPNAAIVQPYGGSLPVQNGMQMRPKKGWLPTANLNPVDTEGASSRPTQDVTYWSGGCIRFPGIKNDVGFGFPKFEMMEYYTFEFRGRRQLLGEQDQLAEPFP